VWRSSSHGGGSHCLREARLLARKGGTVCGHMKRGSTGRENIQSLLRARYSREKGLREESNRAFPVGQLIDRNLI